MKIRCFIQVLLVLVFCPVLLCGCIDGNDVSRVNDVFDGLYDSSGNDLQPWDDTAEICLWRRSYYHFDADKKTVPHCDLTEGIINDLKTAKATGEIAEPLSEEEDSFSYAESGTVWVDFGGRIYRIEPDAGKN